MKKMRLLVTPCIFLMIFSSCTTVKTSSLCFTDEIKKGFCFNRENIFVNINHVNDEGIKNQIYDLVCLELNQNKFKNDSENELKINIIERSFLSGTKYLNSISLRCYVTDSKGNVIAEKNKIITSKKITMLSVIYQDKYLVPLVKAIKRKI